jgi:hypothetical protein
MFQALAPLAHSAPGGYAMLNLLGDEILSKVLIHSGDVKVVTPYNFFIELRDVDASGYAVYDSTFTEQYRIIYDLDNPSLDLSQITTRNMRFGLSMFDFDFIQTQKHGNIFYIGYESNNRLPNIVMVIVADPRLLPITPEA